MDDLAALLRDRINRKSGLRGRILIVEDLTRDVIEQLGSQLNIDPYFFASHLDVFQPDISTPRPYLSKLPSMARNQDSLFLHYHRVLEVDSLTCQSTLVQAMNVPRKVKLLPPTKGVSTGIARRIGFARHCCSVLRTSGKDGLWLCLILVDPSLRILCPSKSQAEEGAQPASLLPRLFQGGFEDFLPRPDFLETSMAGPRLERRSLLEDLIFYWCNAKPRCLNIEAPTLIALSQYPLRIVAAEWMVYLEVMYHSTKQYEVRIGTIPAALEQMANLYADLSNLQRWARRNIATAYKLRYVIDWLKTDREDDDTLELQTLLLKDFSHIAATFEAYNSRLIDMAPIVTSTIQVIDSQRALIETANISRLTHLAMVFVPLTFVTGLFSMNDNIAPGGKAFWLYFVVAIPLCLVVYFLARPQWEASNPL
ncbi:hypothetical protein G7Y79_00032g067600 [Physcia stellaris]|nr:hypothetical protein G7Y79_00032g067600 [Physcia stellaris]